MFRDHYPRLTLTRYHAKRRRLEQLAYLLHTDPERTQADTRTVRAIVNFLRSECHGCAALLQPQEQHLIDGWLCRRCRETRVWQQN